MDGHTPPHRSLPGTTGDRGVRRDLGSLVFDLLFDTVSECVAIHSQYLSDVSDPMLPAHVGRDWLVDHLRIP